MAEIELILLAVGLLVGTLIGYFVLSAINHQKVQLELEREKSALFQNSRLESQAWAAQELDRWKASECNGIRLNEQQKAVQALEEWKATECNKIRADEQQKATIVEQQKAALAIEQWKMEHTETIRKDSLDRSRAVLKGKIGEQFIPYLPVFNFNASDARFIGNPIDFIVFDGYTDLKDGIADEIREIIFVEAKTGKSTQLTTNENRIKRAVEAKKVRWETLQFRLNDEEPPDAAESKEQIVKNAIDPPSTPLSQPPAVMPQQQFSACPRCGNMILLGISACRYCGANLRWV